MPVCKDCVVGLFHACHDEEYCRQEKDALIEQAQKAAAHGGHSLTKFAKQRKAAVWRARCTHCGQEATICLAPSPGEADVRGDAVSGTCTEAETEAKGAPDQAVSWSEDLTSLGK